MVAVCAAAVDGQQDQWEVAASAVTAGDPSRLANDCVASEVNGLLERALAWHEEHPGQNPDIEFPVVAGQTQCGKQAGSLTEVPQETEEPTVTEVPQETEVAPEPEPPGSEG
jgi:hypothetical protein